MKLSVKVGTTSKTVNVFIQDSSSSIGAGLTGLVYNSGSLTAYYALPRAASAAITLATLAAVTSAYSSGGFKEIDATNMPGWYRFDIPDAALASGSFVSIHLKGATNMAPLPIEIELTATDNQDAVRGGMTALPNANAEAAGGLYTRGSGAGQINQPANGQIDANTVKVSGTAQTAGDLYALLTTIAGYIDTEVAAIKSKTDNLPSDPADASDIAGAFSTVNSTLATIASYIDTEIAAIKAKTDNLPASPAAAGDAMALTSGERNSVADAIFGRSLGAESYAANGAVPTLAQMLFMMWAVRANITYGPSGLTESVKKLNGTTEAMTFAIDSRTSTTERFRAT